MMAITPLDVLGALVDEAYVDDDDHHDHHHNNNNNHSRALPKSPSQN
jgi:hypothetical protein